MLRLLVIASIWATAYGGKQDRSFAQISIDGPVDAPQPKGSALDHGSSDAYESAFNCFSQGGPFCTTAR